MTQPRLIFEYFRRISSAILFLFCFHTLNAQVTILSENFGIPTGTTTLANYTISTAPATFQNIAPITFTGTPLNSSDVRLTSPSNITNYALASGNGNVFLTNTIGRDLIISGINTSSFGSLSLSFGVYKSTTADSGSALAVEVSSDGTNYTALTFTALSTGTGTATWFYRTTSGTIPSTSNLRIRFRQTATAAQFRIDDVLLTGDYPVIVSAQSGNWSSTATWVGGVVPTSATNAVISNGHNVVMDNLSFATRDAGVRTTVSSTGSLATNVAITNNGITTVNGNFQINQGGFGGGTGTWTYGASSTLTYNHTSGNYGLVDNTHSYWPSASGPTNVTILNSLNTSGGVTLAVARTVSGIFQTAAGVSLSAVNLTLNGQVILNAGGFFQQSPIYGVSSLLRYNCNCSYGRGAEWLTGSGTVGTTPGYPNDVQISNSSNLNAPNTSAGAFSSLLTVGRDLTIDAGAALSMNFGGGGNKSGPITVNRNILINGTISLGDAVGADLSVKGNWTNNGTFNNNSRTVNLDGTTLQTISGTIITTFSGLTLNNAAGYALSGIDCSVSGTLNILAGKFTTTASRKVIVTSTGSVFRSSGWIFGNLQRHFSSGANVTRTFDIGNSSGYLSATLTFAGVTSAGSVLMSVNDGDISSIASAPLFSSSTINRHWSIRNIDLASSSTYSAQLNFLTADKDAACDITTLRAAIVNSGAWQLYTNVTATTNFAALSGLTLIGIDSLALGNEKGDLNYRTKSSGNWENTAIWEESIDNITWTNASDVPNASTSNATVRATHTIQRTVNVPYTVKNIIVDIGGTLLTNVLSNNYFNIYGNIICNGTIGNSTDNISFNIEGINDTIRGTGSFSCRRIRKSATTNQNTNLVIDIDITTYWNTSASLYNNSDNRSRFNVTVNAGRTVRCASVCVDGIRGNGTANGGGTFTILGNLFADTLYLTTDNSINGFGAHINIGNGGVVHSTTIQCNASGLAGHQLTVQDGGILNVTGSYGFLNFSTTQNTYTLGATSTIHYSATANQSIESRLSSYGHIQFSGSGNKTPNGSFSVRGDWTRTAPSVFVPQLHTITFNGTSSSTQKIRVTGAGGTETFSYLVLQKGAGQKLQLVDDTPTSIQVIGGNGGQPIQLISGNLDINGQLVFMPMVTSGLLNNIGIDGNVADPERKLLSTKTGGIFKIDNADASSRFVSINKINPVNAPRLLVDTGTTMIVGGLNQNSGIDFGSGLAYFSGTLQINTWGYVENNCPIYNSGSFLIYNPGSNYNRYREWDSTSGAGYPHHVIIKNATSVLLNNDSPTGNGKANRGLGGNLTIEAGSSLILGDSTENNKLTIGKTLILDGELRMPLGDTLNQAELFLGKDWLRSSTGLFTDNNKGVHFIGSDTSNINAAGGQFFPFLYQEKSIRANLTQLFSPVYIGKKLKITTGNFDLKDSDIFFRSNAIFTAQFLKVEDGDMLYSGLGRAVVERFIPIDSTLAPAVINPGSHRKSWQFLSVPTFGPQTINQAWQDSATSPNQNRYPGYGTQITGSVPNAANSSIGFDVLTITPSIKQYSPSTNTWIGAANTKSTPIESKKGYMLFVRGDRSVTAFNSPGKSTTLRTRGKLFSPGSQPSSSTIQANQFESVGNPYVSPIDFTLIGKTGTSIENSFWVWDPLLTGVEGLGGYQLLSSVNGDYLPTPGGTVNYPTAQKCSTLQTGQAFFMHAPVDGPVSVFFDENCKKENYASSFRTINSSSKYLRVQLKTDLNSQSLVQDGAVMVWNNNFRKSIDAFDAIKLLNPGSNISFLHSNGERLSIDARAFPRHADTIPIDLILTRNGNFLLHFEPDQLSGTAFSYSLYDQLNDSIFNIDKTQPTDIVVRPMLPLIQNKSRYFLVVKRVSPRTHTPIRMIAEMKRGNDLRKQTHSEETVTLKLRIENQILEKEIKFDEKLSMIKLYDVQGRLLYKEKISVFSLKEDIKPVDFSIKTAGIYYIQLIMESGKSYFVEYFLK